MTGASPARASPARASPARGQAVRAQAVRAQAVRAQAVRAGAARAALLLALLAGCAAPAAPRPVLQRIVISRGLAADYRPLEPTEHFTPDEPFYCAALFTGLRPGVLVSARWLFRDQLIRRTDYVMQQTGNGYVGFELSNANPPWPAGDYQVEILVDHQPAGRATFAVAPGGTP